MGESNAKMNFIFNLLRKHYRPKIVYEFSKDFNLFNKPKPLVVSYPKPCTVCRKVLTPPWVSICHNCIRDFLCSPYEEDKEPDEPEEVVE